MYYEKTLKILLENAINVYKPQFPVDQQQFKEIGSINRELKKIYENSHFFEISVDNNFGRWNTHFVHHMILIYPTKNPQIKNNSALRYDSIITIIDQYILEDGLLKYHINDELYILNEPVKIYSMKWINFDWLDIFEQIRLQLMGDM